jgi:hypothetical protein
VSEADGAGFGALYQDGRLHTTEVVRSSLLAALRFLRGGFVFINRLDGRRDGLCLQLLDASCNLLLDNPWVSIA